MIEILYQNGIAEIFAKLPSTEVGEVLDGPSFILIFKDVGLTGFIVGVRSGGHIEQFFGV